MKVVPVRIEDGRKGKKMNAREEDALRLPGFGLDRDSVGAGG